MASLSEKLQEAHPELRELAAAATDPVYFVGGAVRDLLLGRGPGDVDLVVEGDPATLAAALGIEPLAAHPEFGTLKLELGRREVDVAAARTETYRDPGALPAVDPGATIEADLARRDFTVNAMAVRLGGEGRSIARQRGAAGESIEGDADEEGRIDPHGGRDDDGLIDPHGGRDDLERRLLRVLHRDSFTDDPTRALRAARYAARLGFGLEPDTERLLRATDLGTVSPERRAAELLKLAAEPTATWGFELLADWGLVHPRPGGIELAERVATLLQPPTLVPHAGTSVEGAPRELWREQVRCADAVLAAALGPAGREAELAASEPQRPSEAVDLARGHDAIELVLARALGAEWLDRYLGEWSQVRLEIDGSDLIAAGVESGPAVGRGLAAALAAKLDNGPAGREAELAAALRAARTTSPG